jgi:hypothetical protein
MTTNPALPDAGARYEKRDVSVRAIVLFGVGLFLTLILVVLLMTWLFGYFARTQSLGPPASPFTDARVLPPNPRLQVEPGRDWAKFRAEQEQALNTYGWVDRNPGVVQIPIERAMDLIAERGLPSRESVPSQDGQK